MTIIDSKFDVYFVSETGNPDPKFNSRLASVITDAKSKNIPHSTLETAIKQAVSVPHCSAHGSL